MRLKKVFCLGKYMYVYVLYWYQYQQFIPCRVLSNINTYVIVIIYLCYFGESHCEDNKKKFNVPLVLISTEEKKFKQQFVTILLLQMYYFSNFRALCHVICIKYTYFPSSLFLPCLLSNGILSYTPAKLDLNVMYNSIQKRGKHRK